jgi:hypothetical protein
MVGLSRCRHESLHSDAQFEAAAVTRQLDYGASDENLAINSSNGYYQVGIIGGDSYGAHPKPWIPKHISEASY